MAKKKSAGRGRPPVRMEELREFVRKHPQMRAVDIAKKWNMTPQNVRDIAKRAGIQLAGSARKYSEGV